MKTITYNVNGIRAALKKGLIEWLAIQNADILCLQEVKAESHQVSLSAFHDIGFEHVYWYSAQTKGYSGVALLCKKKPLDVRYGCGEPKFDSEGRIILAQFSDFAQMSVYMPSGTTGDARQSFKMEFLEFFKDYAIQLKKEYKKLIISGDYNICHTEIDIHNPKSNSKSSGFLPEERAWLSQFWETGLIDAFRYFCKDPHHYTWWSNRPGVRDRNMGWRIDYHACTEGMKESLLSCEIIPDAMHSDHCPVSLSFEL